MKQITLSFDQSVLGFIPVNPESALLMRSELLTHHTKEGLEWYGGTQIAAMIETLSDDVSVTFVK